MSPIWASGLFQKRIRSLRLGRRRTTSKDGTLQTPVRVRIDRGGPAGGVLNIHLACDAVYTRQPGFVSEHRKLCAGDLARGITCQGRPVRGTVLAQEALGRRSR
jgi:hypothetical protein